MEIIWDLSREFPEVEKGLINHYSLYSYCSSFEVFQTAKAR
jgi:hypothetical protein